MGDVFLLILSRSITAGWVIAEVIVLRFFLRRAPKWLRCVMWAMVALRLACPFSFESSFSLIPGAENTLFAALYSAVEPGTGIDAGLSAGNNAAKTSGEPFQVSAPAADTLETWTFAGSIVWAGGLAVLLGYAVFSFLRLRRNVEERVLYYENVYLCDAVRTPFILGVFRPRIYLPSDMDDMHLRHVLAHEQSHLKRKDHWWKTFGYMLLAVYWFHPLVWTAYILLCRDIELACDEKVVRNLDPDGRKAYSKALVACSMKGRTVMACPLSFGEVGVKGRVAAVLNYRKPAFWLILAAVGACVYLAVCFLTDPRKDIGLAEMIDARKEELTEQIGRMISEAEAVRYSITEWELTVEQADRERADCYFGANWISSREPEDDPLIQGMYQAANTLSDESQKAVALEVAEGWLAEMRSWPEEEYLEQPIVILLEGGKLTLYYPYVMNGVETLIPLQEYVDAEWTEDAEKRYQDGIHIIEEAVNTAD